jgi:acyl carrier protein
MTNGKLDRSALPAPGRRRPPLKTPFVPPRSDLEKKIADIWSSVLAIDGIGMDDNFFDLGGHSLAASALITQLIQTFQIELPSKSFFDAPTVGEMASIIDQLQQTLATDAEVEQVLDEIEVLTEIDAVTQISPTGGK